MNIDDLKSRWNSMELPPEYSGDELSDIVSRIGAERVSSLRDRLGSISRNHALVCVCGGVIMIPYLAYTPVLGVVAIVFFVFMGLMHFRNYRRVIRIDFSVMTVREALAAVYIFERNRTRLRVIGMSLGLPMALWMCFSFTSVYGPYTLYACLAGAAIGVIIAVLVNRRAVCILREMRGQLNSGV